jgi:hypothetical protein
MYCASVLPDAEDAATDEITDETVMSDFSEAYAIEKELSSRSIAILQAISFFVFINASLSPVHVE